MEFLLYVVLSDSSLKVAAYAGTYFTIEAKSSLKPLAVREHLEWWEKNKETIK
jgi:hypothetical protein